MSASASTLKAAVKKRREVRIDGELWDTANWLLDAGQKDPKGSTHHFRSSLVFRAFAFEAFLNWLGHHLMRHWEYLERLRTWDKLALLIDLTRVKKNRITVHVLGKP